MENERPDHEELSERFDLILGSYSELEMILGSNENGEDSRVRVTLLLKVLNENLSHWGSEAVSKVGFYEGLTSSLLQDRRDEKERADKAA